MHFLQIAIKKYQTFIIIFLKHVQVYQCRRNSAMQLIRLQFANKRSTKSYSKQQMFELKACCIIWKIIKKITKFPFTTNGPEVIKVCD